jgi:cellulose synthase/poly-beta-1,6-N-acetylglucosamine synthase-like glycosyltransferase
MPPIMPSFAPNFIMYCMGLASYVEPMFVKKSNGDNFTVTAIIPAFNEEKNIERTINSVLSQSKTVKKIVIIDDNSTDNTLKVLNKFKSLTIIKNNERIGKAASINQVLSSIETDLALLVDADTELETTFIEKACREFSEKDIIAVCGFVIPSESSSNTLIKNARLVEYVYSQTTLKKGQNMINGLFVLSGCCSVFKTSIIQQTGIPEDTLTEDLDLTWLLELKGYKTSIIDAYASTIEPKGLIAYISQIRRWYMGFFQCLSKYHTALFRKTPLTFTVSLLLLESLFFTILWASMIVLLLLTPFLKNELSILKWLLLNMIGIDLFTVCFPAILKGIEIGSLRDLISGIPIFYSLRIVNAIVWWVTFVEWLFSYNIKWGKTH